MSSMEKEKKRFEGGKNINKSKMQIIVRFRRFFFYVFLRFYVLIKKLQIQYNLWKAEISKNKMKDRNNEYKQLYELSKKQKKNIYKQRLKKTGKK